MDQRQSDQNENTIGDNTVLDILWLVRDFSMRHKPTALSENRKTFMTVRLSPGLSPRSSLESTYCLLRSWVAFSWTLLQEKEKKEAAVPSPSYTTHPHNSHFHLIKEFPKVLSCLVTKIGLETHIGLKSLSLNVYVTLTNTVWLFWKSNGLYLLAGSWKE